MPGSSQGKSQAGGKVTHVMTEQKPPKSPPWLKRLGSRIRQVRLRETADATDLSLRRDTRRPGGPAADLDRVAAPRDIGTAARDGPHPPGPCPGDGGSLSRERGAPPPRRRGTPLKRG